MLSSEALTGSRRANPGLFVLDGFEVDIEHGLLDPTGVHVSGEADHLLGPDERVRQVICHGAKACVAEHSEFV